LPKPEDLGADPMIMLSLDNSSINYGSHTKAMARTMVMEAVTYRLRLCHNVKLSARTSHLGPPSINQHPHHYDLMAPLNFILLFMRYFGDKLIE
jgi:hypothetical protein